MVRTCLNGAENRMAKSASVRRTKRMFREREKCPGGQERSNYGSTTELGE
jgi:hypothetical protein